MRKLLTPQQLSEIPDLYSQENVTDPLCHIKLFTPDSNWTWHVIECSKENMNLCFGFVIGHESELGYFNLDEIENLTGPLGLAVERDTSFTPAPLSEVKRGAK